MTARTKIGNCLVYFVYESEDGWEQYGNYPDKECYLVGYAHSLYAGCKEPINEKYLSKKPTISEVKAFMRECYNVMAN